MATFDKLWDNFPNIEKVKLHCVNNQGSTLEPFEDYCAILLSQAFIRTGITFNNFSGDTCLYADKKHMLHAEQVALWLAHINEYWLGRTEKINPSNFERELKGRKGIVFFKDYWQRSSGKVSNHIDLWNEDKITSGPTFYRSIAAALGIVADFNKSREIWFWEVK